MSRFSSRRHPAREWFFLALIWSALGLVVARVVAGLVPDYSALAAEMRCALILLSALATIALSAGLTIVWNGRRRGSTTRRQSDFRQQDASVRG